ncbi:MAG: site-specific DNA-methyltransferase [Myxococcaceae bacterium]|nr:site-specific DNA-methyltransferase [Myxococcaceae bacterium]
MPRNDIDLPTCVAGDSTRAATFDGLGSARAQALITDPPYCLLTRRRKGGDVRDPKGKKNEGPNVRRFEDVREYRAFTDAWLTNAAAHLDGPMVVWTNLLGKEPIRTAAAKLGWAHLRGEFTWGKRSSDRNSGEETLRVVEVALVLTRDAARPAAPSDAAVPWAVVAGYDDDGEAARWGSHPNHKPFGVIEPLVRTWSRPGDLVLDCFAGSGSIPAAALKLGRRTFCAELDPALAARVTERLQGS